MNGNRLQGALAVLLTLALAISSGGAVRVSAQDAVLSAGPQAPQAAVNNSFTFQGQLNSGGTPLNGTCDMQFSLWDALAGPNQTGGTQTVTAVAVAGGKFTVVLNNAGEIGNYQFTGFAKWLEIGVRCPSGGGNYTVLAPRQPLTAAPYALGLMPGARIDGSLDSELLIAYNFGSGDGLMGYSAHAVGVHGESAFDTGTGVAGESTSGNGVTGESTTGIGVQGHSTGNHGVSGRTSDLNGVHGGVSAIGPGYSTNGIALRIQSGGIKVESAGVNTHTPVFIHKVITGGGGNVCTGANWASVISYPLITGNAGAILIVTPNNGPYSGGTTPVNSIPAVFYDSTNFCGHGFGTWVVYNLSLLALPNNAMYNVLVVVP